MLTDLKVRKALKRAKSYKIYDEGGLFIVITKSDTKLWRMRYKLGGTEKLLSFGPYPEVGVSAARAARDAARAELRAGFDPSRTKQAKRDMALSTDRHFETIARAWHERNSPSWQSAKHTADVLLSLEKHVFPVLGGIEIRDITPPMVLNVLLEVEKSAIETAHRLRQRISAVYKYAIVRGLADVDPAASVGDALSTVKKGKQPALQTIGELRAMLVTVESRPAHALTKLANRLLALTSVRSNELLGAQWDEFADLDGDAAAWSIPGSRTKMKRPHWVPLSRQAVETIAAVRVMSGKGPLLFPNTRWAHKPMSANAIGYMLNRAGYEGAHVPHGWRAAFSTIMNEAFPADRAVIDLMLAHVNKNVIEAAYNRATHYERRRFLTQAWADMLLDGATPAVDLLRGPAR